MIDVGVRLLRSRYGLVSGPVFSDDVVEAWIGIDETDTEYLIKLWRFEGKRPDNLRRALWDAELRTLYRVGSSPGADDTLLVLRDAGVDHDARCFVMVLNSPGYESLASALAKRANTEWLAHRDAPSRRPAWEGLQRLASGIQLLHEQNILHRDVRAETVFYSQFLGPSSLRLGGFEWSVRLGTPSTKAPPTNWPSPPEFSEGKSFGYRHETDWFAFGMLAARILLNVESYASNNSPERHRRVLQDVERSGGKLSDLERTLLLRLIAKDPRERITRGYEVSTAILDIVRALRHGSEMQEDTRPLVLVFDPKDAKLLDRVQESGFVPNPDRPNDAFNPQDVFHTAHLMEFVQQDLRRAQIYAKSGVDYYLLVGEKLVLIINKIDLYDHVSKGKSTSWDMARCFAVSELHWNEGGSACIDLPPSSIVVRSRRQISDRSVRHNFRNWERFLPTIDRVAQLRANLARFHDFIRCTNQLELLIRDSEIFKYRIESRWTNDGTEHLVILELPRKRQTMRFCKIEGGMSEFLQREIESNKPDCKLVVLTEFDEDGLMLNLVDKSDCWTVVQISSGKVELTRNVVSSKRAPVNEGTIRTWGMFGQVALIRRRKRAIDRIDKHSYLLRSLSSPGQVYMDTGAMALPVPLSKDVVDEAKQAAIEDILRVRPIYALQGPPGTGKTTLVAHLLRQIFEDDPVAQVLITAQAHGAVDVLRAKVRDEAFKGIPEERQPLAVRLGIMRSEAGLEEGSAEEVSLQILRQAQVRLKNLPTSRLLRITSFSQPRLSRSIAPLLVFSSL